MADEVLTRFGASAEPADRLAEQAAAAEAILGVHGVSVTARPPTGPAGRASRSVVAAVFPVHDTPTRRDPRHRTVELPKPVTPAVADQFNALFGRV